MSIAVLIWRLLSNCFVCYVGLNFILYCTRLNGKKFIPLWLAMSCLMTSFFSGLNLMDGLALQTIALTVFAGTALHASPKKLLPPFSVVFTLCAYLECFSTIITYLAFGKWKLVHERLFADILITFVLDICFFLALLLVKRYFVPTLRQDSSPFWYALFIPGACFIIFINWLLSFGKHLIGEYFLSLGPSFYIAIADLLTVSATASLLLMAVFAKTIKLSEKHTSDALLKNQLALQKIYISEAIKRNRHYAAIHNNIDSNISLLSSMLDNGEYDEAEIYLSKLQAVNASFAPPMFTGSPPTFTGSFALDVLLNEKLSHAMRSKIRISCNVQIPVSLRVNDMDLCVIFSNIMDNATAACVKVNRKKRFLRISTAAKNDFLFIEAVNSSAVNGPLKPGAGITNISSVASKYQGTVETESFGGVFRITVLLCPPKEQKDTGPGPSQSSFQGTF